MSLNMELHCFVVLNRDGSPFENERYTEIVLSPNGRVWLLSNVPGTAATAREDITERVTLNFSEHKALKNEKANVSTGND